MGTLLATHRASGESAGISSRSRAFSGSTARMAAPAAQFFTTGQVHGHSVGSAMHGLRPCCRCEYTAPSVAAWSRKPSTSVCQPPSRYQTLPAESELQLVEGNTSGHPLGIVTVGADPEERPSNKARLPEPIVWSSQSRKDTPSNCRVSSFVSVIRKRANRHFSRTVRSRVADERTDTGRERERCVALDQQPAARVRKTPGERDAKVLEEPERMAGAIKGMRAEVPMNLVTNMRGGTSAQVSGLLEDNDRPARSRDQRGRRETGQAASDHDHIRVRARRLPSYP